MKNKHIVLVFVLLAALVWIWNRTFRMNGNEALDVKLAAEFLEKYHFATECTLDDGTEPVIKLIKDEHGWRVNFGTLDAAADEDSIKAMFKALSHAQFNPSLVSDSVFKITLTLKSSDQLWQLGQIHQNQYRLTTTGVKTKAFLQAPISHWISAPYEHWIFRKLQVKAPGEIQSLSYEWNLFEPLHFQKTDSAWQLPVQSRISTAYVQDSLLPALGQLNQLEPALLFDPIGDAIKPFAQLHINDGKACTLQCYRLTEQQAEYYIQSSNVPQLYFKLPPELANTIFVRPRV